MVPLVSTGSVSSVTQKIAQSGGRISDERGSAVTARGVCWSEETNPTIADDGGSDIIVHGLCWDTSPGPTIDKNKSTDGPGYGLFVTTITGLSENTTYYLRAYATNSVGTAYGEERTFKTFGGPIFNPDLQYGTLTDIDGNVYRTIENGQHLSITSGEEKWRDAV
jgi:hypothetical protein